MNELALFAGGGGGILGGKLLGWRTACAVEIDPYCRQVLQNRQNDGWLNPFPIWDDIRTFRKDNPKTKAVIEGLAKLDQLVITAGFPCQPFSGAGKQEGADDERNLWPETIRVIREVEPRFALLENVPGLLSFDYFGEILGDLADAGYDAEWDVVSAAECGARHLRKRLWILAYRSEVADDKSLSGRNESENASDGTGRGSGSIVKPGRQDVADGIRGRWANDGRGSYDIGKIDGMQSKRQWRGMQSISGSANKKEWWSEDPAEDTNPFGVGGIERGERERAREVDVDVEGRRRLWGIESRLGRVANGVANRVDRLRAIGNGQVPIVAATAFIHLVASAGLFYHVFGEIEE